MTKAQLTKAIKELNGILGLEPPVPVKGTDTVLSKKIALEVAGLLEPGDFEGDEALSKGVIATIKEICKKHEKAIRKSSDEDYIASLLNLGFLTEEKAPEKTESKAAPEPEKNDELYETVEDAETVKELKTIIRKESVFAEQKKELIAEKDLDTLKDAMLDILDGINSEPEPEPEPEEKKEKTKSTGRINTGSFAAFMDKTLNEGGTWKQMLTKCEQEAKARGSKIPTMGVFKNHAKFRLNKDSNFYGGKKITEKGLE